MEAEYEISPKKSGTRKFCQTCGTADDFEAYPYYGGGGYGYGGYYSRYGNYSSYTFDNKQIGGANPNSNKIIYAQPKKKVFKKLGYTIKMDVDIAKFIQRMMAEYSIEWGVVFTYTIDKDLKELYIDRLYTFPVTSSAGDVDYINESVYPIFAEHSELPKYVKDVMSKGRYAGIMHSHHTMGAWHSGTDLNCIDTFYTDFGNVLSIVFAKKGKILESQAYMSIKGNDEEKQKRYNFHITNLDFPEDLTEETIFDENKHYDNYKRVEAIVIKKKSRYDKFLRKFKSTKKYGTIHKLYENIMSDEESELRDILLELMPDLK